MQSNNNDTEQGEVLLSHNLYKSISVKWRLKAAMSSLAGTSPQLL